MNAIIEVEHLTKIYRLGNLHGSYLTFRDSITQLFKTKTNQGKKHYIKALDDVNLSIDKGEKIGIIGKNGAGKSTFLKILSRITYPTQGSVILRGRVASLLEVGTGFHGELTGRENVYLNGAILGMKRYEINQKFDEIVDFSGVEKFIDTPVKHYSSGMQMRLAFAVSAFLDADILLVDEVLAVGDAEFQKKCLGKMDEISNTQGRTIIFVSHNLNAISNLCEKSILFVNGHLDTFDATTKVIDKYINEIAHYDTSKFWNNINNEVVRPISFRILDQEHNEKFTFTNDEDIYFEIVYEKFTDDDDLYPNIHILTSNNQYVLTSIIDRDKVPKGKGFFKIYAKLEKNLLNQGLYYIGIAFTNLEKKKVEFFDNYCVNFEIEEIIEKRNYPFSYPLAGIIRRELTWIV